MEAEVLALNGGTPVREKKIYYGHQFIDEADIKAVTDVLKSDFLTCGPKIEQLEKRLCALTGAQYAVAVANGTAALHIAALAAGIKEGDEVITTPITFAASANCAIYCGAAVVFADIDPQTYNISAASIEEKITERTKAVIAVDYTGQPAQLDKIREICKAHHLIFIEDGAHSIGSSYKGVMVGNVADFTTFSFHPVKTVTGGEGGAVLTNDKQAYERLKLFRSHGITRDKNLLEHESDGAWYYEQIALGFNYRMTDISAALLLSQLDKLSMFKERRKEIVKQYKEAFQTMDTLTLQQEIEGADTVRHLYILRWNLKKMRVGRKEIFEALAAEGICCNVHYIPVYYFPYYEKLGYEKGLCPQAEKLYEEMMSIPLYYAMTKKDVEDVIHAVRKVSNALRKE